MNKIFIALCLFLFQDVAATVTKETTSRQSYFVGELGAEWQFPSDHLPVGASIDNLHFALWNVLNSEYLHWIEKNGQGLKDSLIITSNTPLSENLELTVREDLVVEYIIKMINHPTHPRSVIALQEVGESVFRELLLKLPSFMHIFPVDADEQGVEDIFVVDRRIFEILDSEISKYTFKDNTIVKLTLREKSTGVKYRFIQSHVPGGPVNSLPASIELAEKVMQEFDPENITIILGDMNQTPDYFIPQFEQAAKKLGLPNQPFNVMDIPYPTHIDTERNATWIDNIFIANPYPEVESRISKDSSELFEELQPILDLLERSKL